MVLIHYGVAHFIEHPLPPNADAATPELDAHLVLWIYATLAEALADHVVGATSTYELWTRIRDYFLANRAARYMMLNRQYRNLKQGDLSIAEYARRMKLLSAGLADIDHAFTKVDLTTQFLHGIDKRLETIRIILGDTVPLTPFEMVFSRLKLAEENQAQPPTTSPSPSSPSLAAAPPLGAPLARLARRAHASVIAATAPSSAAQSTAGMGTSKVAAPALARRAVTVDMDAVGVAGAAMAIGAVRLHQQPPCTHAQSLHGLLRPLRHGPAQSAPWLGSSELCGRARSSARLACPGLPDAVLGLPHTASSTTAVVGSSRDAASRLQRSWLPQQWLCAQ